MKTHPDHEHLGTVTGNVDRLTDEELDLIVWALSLDLKGDMGLRSNAGVLEVSGNMEPIGKTVDKAGVVTSMYVKKLKGASRKNEMGDRMLEAAALDREARRILGRIGEHRQTLWRCYVAKYPEDLRASLAAFADLGPLAPGTAAATVALETARRERGDRSPNELSYCQALSTRVLKSQHEGIAIDELDGFAMQAICGEAEPILADACKAVKKAITRNPKEKR